MLELIARFEAILADERDGARRSSSTSCASCREQYGDERRTEIVDETRRDHDRGPDRRRGHGRHHLPRRLHQAQRRVDALPRQRRGGKGTIGMATQGRGLRRAPLRRLDARLPPVLHRPRARSTGSRSTRSRRPAAPRKRQGDRQPAAARSRTRRSPPCCRCASSTRAATSSSRPRRAWSRRPTLVGLLATRARAASSRIDARRGRRADRGAAHRRQAARSSSPPRKGMAIRFRRTTSAPMGRTAARRAAASRSTRTTRSSGMEVARAEARRSSPSPSAATASAPRSTSTACRAAAARASSTSGHREERQGGRHPRRSRGRRRDARHPGRQDHPHRRSRGSAASAAPPRASSSSRWSPGIRWPASRASWRAPAVPAEAPLEDEGLGHGAHATLADHVAVGAPARRESGLRGAGRGSWS